MTIETKLFELRDKATFIPIIASRMQSRASNPGDMPVRERETWLLYRAGYPVPPYIYDGVPLVLLARLYGGRAYHAYYDWCDRTFTTAHAHIAEHWDELTSGDLIDVRVILGETTTPCATEQHLESEA